MAATATLSGAQFDALPYEGLGPYRSTNARSVARWKKAKVSPAIFCLCSQCRSPQSSNSLEALFRQKPDQIDHAVRITPFVVVPSHHLQ
jgi:hypothetical protein